MTASRKVPGLDDTMLALADPTRREILRRLSSGEARVTDVARPFSISLNSVSKHIRLLERAGLVHRRKKGREHYLSFNTEPLTTASRWIARQQELWSVRLDDLATALRAEADDQSRTPNSAMELDRALESLSHHDPDVAANRRGTTSPPPVATWDDSAPPKNDRWPRHSNQRHGKGTA